MKMNSPNGRKMTTIKSYNNMKYYKSKMKKYPVVVQEDGSIMLHDARTGKPLEGLTKEMLRLNKGADSLLQKCKESPASDLKEFAVWSDTKQAYYDFLSEQGAKEKVREIIADGIEKWKKEPAYEYLPTVDHWTNDYSGEVRQIADKTIGDICKTDMDVLRAYDGNSRATYTSHCGLSYTTVAEEIAGDINTCLYNLRTDFIHENEKMLVENYSYEIDELVSRYKDASWIDRKMFSLPLSDGGREYIEDFMSDDAPNYEWFDEQFPEYLSEDEYGAKESVFSIGG